jgi:hypothetical protein
MDTSEIEFDAFEAFAAGSGSGKPKGKLQILGDNIINSDPSAVPIMRLTIKAKIPAESLPAANENNYVYRHTLKLNN